MRFLIFRTPTQITVPHCDCLVSFAENFVVAGYKQLDRVDLEKRQPPLIVQESQIRNKDV